jgi:predicted phage terminase large subunit-like protein
MNFSERDLLRIVGAKKRIKVMQEAKRLEDSFYEFLKASWHVFDPADFVDNWHLEDICNHMEAVSRGYISRLLLNEPPRTGKTAIVSICYVPWVWAQRERAPLMGPQVSFFYASYAEQLSLEHSLKCRRLIESRWYQELWGDRFQLRTDRNRTGHFENNKGGYRMASSVDAKATGYGADVLCLPPGERVLTDSGWLPIEHIVRDRLPVRIAGFDHGQNQLIWQNIVEYESNPGREIVRIDFDGGSFKCTADHPVFVEGRGYIPAAIVQAGEILRTVPGMPQADGPKPGQSDMRGVSQPRAHRGEHEAVRNVRHADICEPGAPSEGKWSLLLARVFGKRRDGRAQPSMDWRETLKDMPEMFRRVRVRAGARQAAALLQPFVRDQGALGSHRAKPDDGLRGVRRGVQAQSDDRQKNEVLLKGLQGFGARQGDVRREQSEVRSRRLATQIRTWLDKVAEVCGATTGWLPLHELRTVGGATLDGASRPSHQLRQERYVDGQSNLRVPALPRTDARAAEGEKRVGTAFVRAVKRCDYADATYNLNVEPCHNYFVGGALVHNCADDPHLVKEAESEKVREDVVRWWSETMPSRLNNRKTGAMIVVMQRIHEGDLAGDILDRDTAARKKGYPPNYVHFCVPMSYVPCKHVNAWVGDKIQTFIGDEIDDIPEDDIFWADRRTEDGELLWPERYPANEVFKLEQEMGPYSFSGQYQQTPAPRGGGIIKEEWWRIWDKETAEKNGSTPDVYPGFEYILASLDTAYTEKEENDPSALSIWGIFRDPGGNPMIFLMYCWHERYLLHDLVTRVGSDCKKFKVDRLLIEDKAAGHSVSQELARLFGSFDFGIELINPRTGFIKSPDKVARLQTVVHLFAEGLIYAPDKEWADDMIKQCSLVPRAIHDDLADTCSMALIYLRRAGWAQKKEERAFEVEDEKKYRPRSGALYPI